VLKVGLLSFLMLILIVSNGWYAWTCPVSGVGARYTGPMTDAHAHPVFHTPEWINNTLEIYHQAGVDKVVMFDGNASIQVYEVRPNETIPSFNAPAGGQMNQSSTIAEVASALEGGYQWVGEMGLRHWGESAIPADNPVALQIYKLCARYQVPITVHQDSKDYSGAYLELERASYLAPDTIFVFHGWWFGVGHLTMSQMERMIVNHPNLYVELAGGLEASPGPPWDQQTFLGGTARDYFAYPDGRIRDEWRTIFEKYPDRFINGFDFFTESAFTLVNITRRVDYWRNLLGQIRLDAAEKIAYLNVETLLARRASLATQSVTIDGRWTDPLEWRDAAETKMHAAEGNGVGYFRVKQDATWLYILAESLVDTAVEYNGTNDSGDRMCLFLDTLHNGGTSPQFDDYRLIADWRNSTHTAISASRGNGTNWVNTSPVLNLQGKIGIDTGNSPHDPHPHVVGEFKLPISFTGRDFGVFMRLVDSLLDTGNGLTMWLYWPGPVQVEQASNPSTWRSVVVQNTITLSLNAGWNLISLPIVPDSYDIRMVLSSPIASGELTIVWSYTGTPRSWRFFIPGKPSTLTTMRDGEGYWIYMSTSDVVTVRGTVIPPISSPPNYELVAGWNLLGFKPQPTVGDETIGVYLSSVAGKYDLSNVWVYRNADGTWVRASAGTVLHPGDAMWILVSTSTTLKP